MPYGLLPDVLAGLVDTLASMLHCWLHRQLETYWQVCWQYVLQRSLNKQQWHWSSLTCMSPVPKPGLLPPQMQQQTLKGWRLRDSCRMSVTSQGLLSTLSPAGLQHVRQGRYSISRTR